MATPVSNSVPLVGNSFVDGLTQGSSWTFGGGAHTLTYSFDLNFDGPQTDWTPTLISAVEGAFAAWQNVANLQFVPVGTPSAQPMNDSTADIAIALVHGQGLEQGFVGLGVFPDPAYADTLLSAGDYSRTGGNFPYPRPEGDIALEDQFSAFLNGLTAPGGTAFTIILHEIGHALGLKHPVDAGGNSRPTFAELGIGSLDTLQYTVMTDAASEVASVSGFPATPMPLDILAIQQIYGANMSYRTGDDVYTLQNDGVVRTIWDAGGTDTFDASNLFFNVTINLQPGAYSTHGTIFGPIGDLGTAIAYNTTIENAIGGRGNDTITGNYAANNLSGGLGNDTIDGGPGDDTMAGGPDSDVYIVDSSLDVVIENPTEGVDRVQSAASFVLSPNVEDLTLTGTTAVDGTGNALANRLAGNAGNNRLDGGLGIDRLEGGAGNDTYVIAAADINPPTFFAFRGDPLEWISQGQSYFFDPGMGLFQTFAVDSGDPDTLVDSIAVNFNNGSSSWYLNFSTTTLGQPLLPGTYTNAQRNSFEQPGHPGMDISGESRGSNMLTGSFTVHTASFDYSGSTPQILDLSITFEQHSEGGPLALTGTLNVNHASGSADVIFEALNGGLDTVESALTFVLPANVENLTLTGSDNVNGSGNALDNVLTGNSGINTLTGGLGNDSYVIQSVDDIVVEDVNSGSDTVVAPFTYTLAAAHVENLTLSGNGNIDGAGTDGENVITGNAGANTLTGKAGDDTLKGGTGNDTYRYALGDGADVVEDFDNAPGNLDRIAFESGILATDIHVVADGTSRVLLVRGSTDRIRLSRYAEPGFRIERVEFAGGGTLAASLLDSPSPNALPVITPVAAVQGAIVNQPVAYGSLFGAVDADMDAITKYQLFDTAFGGGSIARNGIAQTARQVLEINAADLGNYTYRGGAGTDSEFVGARAFDGVAWGEWTNWQMNTLRTTNVLPVISAPAVKNFVPVQAVRFSTFMSVTDADGDPMVRFEVRDTNAAPGSTRIWANGALQAQGFNGVASTTTLADIWVLTGTDNGTDTIEIRAHDGYGFGEWKSVDIVTRAPDRAPISTPIAFVQSVPAGGDVAAEDLFVTADADGDPILQYEFFDTVVGGGLFTVNGIAQPGRNIIPVTAANLSSVRYRGAATPASEAIGVRAYDGALWSAWANWTMNSLRANNALPVMNGPAVKNFEPGQAARFSSFISVTDTDNDAMVRFEVRDNNAAAGSTRIWANGALQPQGFNGVANTSSLSDIWLLTGPNFGTDTIEIRANDGYGWSDWKSVDVVTRGPNHAPLATPTGAVQGVTIGQSIAASALFSTSDADGDAITSYRFRDDGTGGGHFSVGGVTMAALQNFEVPAVSGAIAPQTVFSDQLDGSVVNGADWLIPTFLGNGDGTFVGRTQFRVAQNASLPAAGGGNATIKLETYNPFNGPTPSLYGTDLITRQGFTAGQGLDVKVRARMDGPVTPGTVGGIFLYALNPLNDDLHDEIDFELLGTRPGEFQTNIYGNEPVGTGHPTFVAYSSGTIADYHTYEIKWLSDQVSWFVDGALVRTTASNIPAGQMQLHLNMWAPEVEWPEAYSPDLHATLVPGDMFSMSVDSVIVQQLSTADLAGTTYVAGSVEGQEKLWVQVYDGTAWSEWTNWQMNTLRATNALPVINGPASKTFERGQAARLSTFLFVSDADGDPMVRFEVRDNNSAAGSTLIWANGALQAQGFNGVANTGSLSDIWVLAGPNNGTDTLEIRAHDGYSFGDWKSIDIVTRGPNRAPVVTPTAPTQNVNADQTKAFSLMFNTSDADSDPITQFELFDTGAGGGHIEVNGDVKQARTLVTVNALDNVVYRGASSGPGSEVIGVRARDGLAFSEWASWQMNTLAA